MKKNKFLLIASLLFISLQAFSVATAQDIATPDQTSNNEDNLKTTFDKIDSSRFYGKAVLQILNKTTAKTSVIEVPIGGVAEISQITIKVNKCWQAPLDQKPDSRILMEIFENKSGENKRIFFGWMISSSPSVSSLEHPIYDVTALSCKNK